MVIVEVIHVEVVEARVTLIATGWALELLEHVMMRSPRRAGVAIQLWASHTLLLLLLLLPSLGHSPGARGRSSFENVLLIRYSPLQHCHLMLVNF